MTSHLDRSAELAAWNTMVAAIKVWSEQYMDQWDKFKYQGSYGPVYVSIKLEDEYPDSFDEVKGDPP